MYSYEKKEFNAGLMKTRMVTNFVILKDGDLFATVSTENEAIEAVAALNKDDQFHWSGYQD